ncbi:hydrolase [Virgisporangium aliadipatigenens]|uniref:Hydrolase n=1 Tax=Virgisporangium aliadipatigenens TaxID=741659 RepID=A0A8J4DVW6_9ACTN|nr:alpha/beta hydrolase [Virgisporangium aliadipatigenens]GIJ51583.1 hydrolase [Virgisporangium aliadipatigenens]
MTTSYGVTQYLQRGEGRIAYDVRGEGPLVVCVPGVAELRSAFRYTVPALVEAGYRVATTDLRGHGESDDSFSAFDNLAIAADLLALVDHLGGPALIVGNSMGASAAVCAAAEEPSKIAGLALLGPFVRDGNRFLALLTRVLLRKPWGPAFWGAYYPKFYPGRRPADYDTYVADMKAAWKRGSHWQSFTRMTRTSHGAATVRLGKVTAPTLVVMGSKDPDWSDPAAEAAFVRDSLRGDLLMVPESGHYPMADNPEVVNPALVTFAARVYPRA